MIGETLDEFLSLNDEGAAAFRADVRKCSKKSSLRCADFRGPHSRFSESFEADYGFAGYPGLDEDVERDHVVWQFSAGRLEGIAMKIHDDPIAFIANTDEDLGAPKGELENHESVFGDKWTTLTLTWKTRRETVTLVGDPSQADIFVLTVRGN